LWVLWPSSSWWSCSNFRCQIHRRSCHPSSSKWSRLAKAWRLA